MWRAILVFGASLPAFAQNARVDDLLGHGVFGVKWSDPVEVVTARYPGGEMSMTGGVRTYEIRDARSVFELERGSRDKISFGFFSQGLAGVSVTFPDCAAALTAMTKFLGERDSGGTIRSDFPGAPPPVDLGTWSGTDVTLRLIAYGRDCTLTMLRPSRPMEASRQQLGLE